MQDIRAGWTSASNAQADALCPGRHNAQKGLPERDTGDSAFGDAIHAALASADPSKLTLEQRDVYDSCRAIANKLATQFFPAGIVPTAITEQRLWCEAPPGQFKHSGQADVIWRHELTALILDFKSLTGTIEEAPSNLQLRDLAVLEYHNNGSECIGVAIVQPLVTHSPTICVYDAAALKQSAVEMFQRIRASNDPNARRIPGETQCKFCKAKTICREYQQWSGSLLPAPQELFQIAMAAWTPEQCAQAADILAPAAKRLEEIKEFLKARLQADSNAIPGWTLAPGAIRKLIINAQGVFNRFIEIGGKPEDFIACVKVNKSELKTAVNKLTSAKGKALEQAITALTNGCIEEKQNAPSLERTQL